MTDSTFLHPLMKAIEYKHHSFLQITGLNLKVQYYIQQVIDWATQGHRYTEKQIEDLNQEELNWVCKGKKIGKSQYEYLVLKNREDLIFHLSPKKGSLLSYYLNLIQNEIIISEYVIEINAIFDKIALSYQSASQSNNINLMYHMKPIQIKEINSTYLESFIGLESIQSLEFMSNKDLLDEFIKILHFVLQRSEKQYLLRLDNLCTLLNKEQIQTILHQLYHLSMEYQLDVINFAKNEYELLVNENSLGSILICGDIIEQLTDYRFLEDYIRRNYPKIYEGQKIELLLKIRQVTSYLLSKNGSHFVKEPTEQILFVLLNQGMGFCNYDSVDLYKINPLEWNFLEENLYKKL